MQKQYKNLWQQFQSEYQSKETGDDFYYLLLSMARGLTQHKEEAEDLTQDILLSYLTSQPKVDIQNLYQYVYRTIKNRFINLSKASEKRILREDTFLVLQELQNDDTDNEEKIKQQKKFLFVSLRLKEKECQFLEMLFTLSLEEVSSEMNVSLKTAKNKKCILLKKLKNIAISLLFLFAIQVFNSM
jgi:RNA polymerase sigma factor (sigma-70 family)